MSERSIKGRRITPTLPISDDERDGARDPASGRVGFDARGNAVWEWRKSDHEFVRDASTTLVRKMQVPSLALERTGIVRKANQPVPGWKPAVPIEGGSPYHRNGSIAMKAASQRHAAPRDSPKIIVTSRSQPGLLDRFKDWIGRGSR